MMNEKKELKYVELLDLDYALSKAEITAKREWDDVVQWKEDDEKDGGLLYRLRYEDVKELRDAQKILKRVIDVLRKNDLYSHED